MAVTVTKRRTNVNGAFREVYLTLTVGVTGDTYDTKLKNIIMLECSNTSITAMTASAGVITFTGTAAAGTFVKATGW